MKSIIKAMAFSSLLLASGILGAGCASVSEVPVHASYFQLYLDVEPKDTVIEIDGELMGTTQNTVEKPIYVQAGTKRILLTHEGYYPYRYTLEYIQPGEIYTLTTKLIRKDF